MKAIKHITAGLLHIEVIGQIPDPTIFRARSGRSQPTSKAQGFYNLKSSWRELELMLATNFGAKDMVLTLTYDDEHLPPNKHEAGKLFQKFATKLRSVRRRRDEELLYIYCIEGFHGKSYNPIFGEDCELEDKRLHHHAVINRIGPDDLEEIRSLWPYGGYIRVEPLDVHYYRELAKYLTKEARDFGRGKPGERTWRASRNLKKYSVEYIEIPSDSVTLAAPSGAVDYTSFHDKNPYGFADCIGARYLLFPSPPKLELSYSVGRPRPKPRR